MSAGLEVRRARPEEIPACADLYLRVLIDTFTWQAPDRHHRDDFLRAAHEEEVFVAVEAGEIVGLAAFYRPQNFLHSLYVGRRGQGIGKALLDQVLTVATGPVSLKVQAPNRRAQRFYAREGFTCVERGQDPGSDVAWLRLMRDQAAPRSAS